MKKSSQALPAQTLVPNHIAIIPDGNRRWARARGLPTFRGHQKGFDLTPVLARASRKFGVHTLTIWAFSTENWDRSPREIAYLMKKYEDFVGRHLKEAQKEKAKIIHLGRKDRLPSSLVKKLSQAEKATQSNRKYVLNIGLDYGGRDEILRATKEILKQGIAPEKLDEKTFSRFLDTHDQPYPFPDLVIRTSGEQRLSGFLSWQSAYAEFYWLKEHFPDFSVEKLREAILEYSRRRRRFGGNDEIPKVRFDPEKLSKFEIAFWQCHNNGNQGQLPQILAKGIAEQYRLGKTEAKKAALLFLKGVKHHDKKEWQKAIKVLSDYYRMIKQKAKFVFNPEVVAKLEINWWQIHDNLENSQDKLKLAEAFQALYGEIYRLSELQTAKVAHLKALATLEHDLAENGESKKRWQVAEDYLTKCYQALREVAA